VAIPLKFGTHAHSIDEVRAIGRLGLDFAELWLDSPEFATTESQRPLADLAAKHGLFYTAHAPQEDWGNPKELEESIPDAVGLAATVGASPLTMHVWLDPRFFPPEVIHYKVQLLGRLDGIAAANEVQLLIENCSEEPEHFRAALETVPGLGMTLDTGHAELYARQNKSVAFIEAWGPRIKNVHLNDNRGGSTPADDIHLGLGEGVIELGPIAAALREMGYDGVFVLEMAAGDIEKSRHLWTELWQSV
jgi:sugar phosphate isomerase/epimerase